MYDVSCIMYSAVCIVKYFFYFNFYINKFKIDLILTQF